MTLAILLLIALALLFDFLNGFHDSANSIATIVSTRVLSPRYAVIWAAFFNFIAFLFFGLHVANTIGKGIIDIAVIDNRVIFGTLIGACGWNIITWYFGLPTSSSHALIGGMIGSALVKAGPNALVWKGISKTVIFIFVSPILGLLL
ncbi:MAG: inorganic phosphate transporter, partial [Candidatus Omnitrophica bacterium]|nr:inorganic phosphate transporter [Candidatus Omnitrophota bacterium]